MKKSILLSTVVILFSTNSYSQIFSDNDIDSISSSLSKLSSKSASSYYLNKIENEDAQNLIKASKETNLYYRNSYLNKIENEDTQNLIKASKETNSYYRDSYLNKIKNQDVQNLIKASKEANHFDWNLLITLSLVKSSQ